MFSMKIKWVRFAKDEQELTSLLKGKLCSPLRVNSKAVLIVKHQDKIHLVKNRCPHQGITLERAECVNGEIICPWHHYGFNLENGQGGGLYLEIYPVEKRADGYYAAFEYFSLF
jgi:nitrite reductase/ring-hydroxylating ferredoxin subunit